MSIQMEYLQKLEGQLGNIPQEKKQDILDDIRRHFAEGLQEGLTEEQLAESLGAPETLAREYRDGQSEKEASVQAEATAPVQDDAQPDEERSYYADQAQVSTQNVQHAHGSSQGILGRIFSGIFLFFLNLCVALPVLITVYALCFALWVTGAALALSGVVVVVLIAVNQVIPLWFLTVSFPLFTFATGITIGALGGIILLYGRRITGWLLGGTRRYLTWNRTLMNGGKQNV